MELVFLNAASSIKEALRRQFTSEADLRLRQCWNWVLGSGP